MTATPFFFGESAQPLFGIYDPAHEIGRRGAVLCYPWAQEYLWAHKSFRQLARLLARRGVHVLRFDYTACGDSAGDDMDGSLAQWVRDVGTAVDELRDLADLDTVTLVGLRLGAALASLGASGRRDVDRLALWDPVFDGPTYLGELTGEKPGIEPAAFPIQVRGFPVTRALWSDLMTVRLDQFQRPPPAAALFSTTPVEVCRPLAEHLRSVGADVTSLHVPGPDVWTETGAFGSAGMPVAMLRAIADCVTA